MEKDMVHHRHPRGFGRIWAEAALKRGDRATATSRKLADVADLAERFGDAVLPSTSTSPTPCRRIKWFIRHTPTSAGWTS